MESDDGDDGNDGGDEDDDGVDDDNEWSQLNLSICFCRGCCSFSFFSHALGAMTLRNVDGMAVGRTRHEYSRRPDANNYVAEGARTYAIASYAPGICLLWRCQLPACAMRCASGYLRLATCFVLSRLGAVRVRVSLGDMNVIPPPDAPSDAPGPAVECIPPEVLEEAKPACHDN